MSVRQSAENILADEGEWTRGDAVICARYVLESQRAFRERVNEARVALNAGDGAVLAYLLAAAEAERDRLKAALEEIGANAQSWHGPEPPDSGHVRALHVIGDWCRAALAAGEEGEHDA